MKSSYLIIAFRPHQNGLSSTKIAFLCRLPMLRREAPVSEEVFLSVQLPVVHIVHLATVQSEDLQQRDRLFLLYRLDRLVFLLIEPACSLHFELFLRDLI